MNQHFEPTLPIINKPTTHVKHKTNYICSFTKFSHAKPPENGQTLPPDIEHKPFDRRILDYFCRKKPDTVLEQKKFYFCKNDDSRNARLTESITTGSPTGCKWSPIGANCEEKCPQDFKNH